MPGGRRKVVAVHDGDAWAVDSRGRDAAARRRVGRPSTCSRPARRRSTSRRSATGSGSRTAAAARSRRRSAPSPPSSSGSIRRRAARRRRCGCPPAGSSPSRAGPGHLAAHARRRLGGHRGQVVVRIDPGDRAITARTRGPRRAYAIAAGGAGVWGSSSAAGCRARRETARVRRRVKLPAATPVRSPSATTPSGSPATGEGKLWRVGATRRGDRRGRSRGRRQRGGGRGRPRLGRQRDRRRRDRGRRDAMRVVRTVRLGGIAALAHGRRRHRVGRRDRHRAAATSRSVAGVEPLPASICEPAVARPGRPGRRARRLRPPAPGRRAAEGDADGAGDHVHAARARLPRRPPAARLPVVRRRARGHRPVRRCEVRGQRARLCGQPAT